MITVEELDDQASRIQNFSGSLLCVIFYLEDGDNWSVRKFGKLLQTTLPKISLFIATIVGT
jgi:hypothetical protein